MSAMTLERATAAAEAWNTHDAEQVVAFFADDGAFHGPIGPDHLGQSNHGKDAIRAAVNHFFTHSPHGQFTNLRVRVDGDSGIYEWDFEDVAPDGNKTVVAGCDLLTFKGDQILSKSVFLKTPAGAALLPSERS